MQTYHNPVLEASNTGRLAARSSRLHPLINSHRLFAGSLLLLGSILAMFTLTAAPAVEMAAAEFVRPPLSATATATTTTAIIRTFAGGSADGQIGLNSTFSQPYEALLALDGSIVVADSYNNRIRVIEAQTGVVRTIAGTGDNGAAGDDGPALRASLNSPQAVALGPDGNLYFADTWNDRVRRIDAATGIITLVAGKAGGPDAVCNSVSDGQPATADGTCSPTGVAVDSNSNVYIAEESKIRRVDGQTGIITTVSETTPGPPRGLAVDQLDNLMVSDYDPLARDYNYRIRYINFLDHTVTVYPAGPTPVVVQGHSDAVIAGGNGKAIYGDEGDGGPATAAAMDWAPSVRVVANGGLLFTEDVGYQVPCPECPGGRKISWTMLARRIDGQTGIINTIAGNHTQGVGPDNVLATQSALNFPETAFTDANGNVVVVDRGNSRLRTISKLDGTITTSAGADLDAVIPATQASIYRPAGVAAGPRGVYFTDPWNIRVRRVNPDGSIATVAGSSLPCVRLGAASNECGATTSEPRGEGGPATQAKFFGRSLGNLSVSPDGLVAVVEAGIRVINDSDETITLFPSSSQPLVLAPGVIGTAGGNGAIPVPQTGSIDFRDAELGDTADVSFAPNGDMLIAEAESCRILRVNIQTGQISVVTGLPPAQAVVPVIGQIYAPLNFADGPIDQARFLFPFSVAAAPDGTTLYVADLGNNRIRKIDLAIGLVTTIAGSNVYGFAGDGLPAALATLCEPLSIRLGPDGSIFFLDYLNQRIRKIGTDGNINTVAGSGPTLVTGTAVVNDPVVCADYSSSAPCGHFSGDGGPATSAQINLPYAIAVDRVGRLFIADTSNNRIRSVDFGVPILSIGSRKVHGGAGAFDVDLPLFGTAGIECRSAGTNGDYTMVFTFAYPLTSVDGASVTSGSGSINSGAIGSDPHQYVVHLIGVTNAQTTTITLSNVADTAGDFSSNISGSMSVLVGDVNASGRVDAADVSSVRQQTLQPITSSNFRNDINASGRIDAADVSIARQQTLTSLP